MHDLPIKGIGKATQKSEHNQTPYIHKRYSFLAVFSHTNPAPYTIVRSLQGVPQTLVFCVAAILGDLTGSLWLVPSEVVKLQMQVIAIVVVEAKYRA